MKKIQRRAFVQSASTVALGSLLLPSFGCNSKTTKNIAGKEIEASITFGIQLYSLRDIIGDNTLQVLQQLSEAGYQTIESYEGKKGMFWGFSPAEFLKRTQDMGLQIVSSHCNIHEKFEEKAAQAAAVGMTHLICPWVGPQKSMEDWKRITEQFQICGEICKKNGIRFAYHNHDYSFIPVEGVVPQTFLMENTDSANTDFEMDMYWVVTAGENPIEWLRSHPDRWKLCHIKDREKGKPLTEKEVSCDIGTGSIDYASILKEAGKLGMQHYIVEQEKYPINALESAIANAAYMKKYK